MKSSFSFLIFSLFFVCNGKFSKYEINFKNLRVDHSKFPLSWEQGFFLKWPGKPGNIREF